MESRVGRLEGQESGKRGAQSDTREPHLHIHTAIQHPFDILLVMYLDWFLSIGRSVSLSDLHGVFQTQPRPRV